MGRAPGAPCACRRGPHARARGVPAARQGTEAPMQWRHWRPETRRAWRCWCAQARRARGPCRRQCNAQWAGGCRAPWGRTSLSRPSGAHAAHRAARRAPCHAPCHAPCACGGQAACCRRVRAAPAHSWRARCKNRAHRVQDRAPCIHVTTCTRGLRPVPQAAAACRAHRAAAPGAAGPRAIRGAHRQLRCAARGGRDGVGRWGALGAACSACVCVVPPRQAPAPDSQPFRACYLA